MATAVLTVSEFLLARIAEDEAVALAGNAKDTYGSLGLAVGSQISPGDRVTATPARVLAECVAKRRIVAQLDMSRPPRSIADHVVEGELELVAMHLAAVYADHPDYRDEWRP